VWGVGRKVYRVTSLALGFVRVEGRWVMEQGEGRYGLFRLVALPPSIWGFYYKHSDQDDVQTRKYRVLVNLLIWEPR